jgi:membrane fusion protein, heavy metal efflux system
MNQLIYYIKIVVASAFIVATITSCTNKNTSTETLSAKPDTTAMKEENAGTIELTNEQIKAVGIEIGNIEEKNLNAVVRASGELAVPPQNKADVNVLMGGIVRKIFVLEGQNVSKGQVLASIENPDFIRMQQDYLTTKNEFAYTQAEYQRQKELQEAKAGTGKNFQQAEANYNASKAKILTLEKQLQQLGINPSSSLNGNIITQVNVTAPISGTVGHIAVNTGSYAETLKPLMEIIDNSQIHCDLIVYEKDLFKVKVGQKVNFMLTNQNNIQIQGEIYGINKSFEDESKGIIVHAVIKGAARYKLIQGMYVTALIDIGNQQTQAVPDDAIVRSEGKDYIFIVSETQEEITADKNENTGTNTLCHFTKAEVATGVKELGYTQITPLEKFDDSIKIVTKGAFYVLSKANASGEEEE